MFVCAGSGNGRTSVTPHTATGNKDSLIMLEGSRTALHLIWATQACGQMNCAAWHSLLSVMEIKKKVSGSISVLMKTFMVDTAAHAK